MLRFNDVLFLIIQNNAHKLPVAFENLSGLLASRDSRRYNRHRYNRGPPDDHDFNKDSSGFNENCRGIIGLDVKYSNASIWHEGLGGNLIFDYESPTNKVERDYKFALLSVLLSCGQVFFIIPEDIDFIFVFIVPTMTS